MSEHVQIADEQSERSGLMPHGVAVFMKRDRLDQSRTRCFVTNESKKKDPEKTIKSSSRAS
jgi:hypothetical protein